MYESKAEAKISRAHFTRRMIFHGFIAFTLLIVSLGIGILGYFYFEGLSFVDAFLNSAMLLGGMGPVNPPVTDYGKLFAGVFALYAGLVFIILAAIILMPIAHRLLHKFHWDDK